MTVSLTFEHRPVPWSRTVRGDRTPRRLKQDKYINDLAMMMKVAAKGETYDGAVKVRIRFDYVRRIDSFGATLIEISDQSSREDMKTSRADLDNLCKMVLEALQKSGIVKDDAQVAILEAEKVK